MKTLFESGKRTVVCGDSLLLLPEYKNIKCIITSLPDPEEMGMALHNYPYFLENVCELLYNAISPESVIFFYQTNRKYGGRLIDKNNLVSKQFYKKGCPKILEKIVLRQEPGIINRYRPTYTNLFAFSHTQTAGTPTADVIYAGEMIYKNAMGMNAILVCMDYIKTHFEKPTIFDPFCGQGSVLKVANQYGFDSIGIDINSEQCQIAKTI
jgi:hypothetical protein